jgi:hypothetical protein
MLLSYKRSMPDKIASVCHALLYKCAVRMVWKKLKFSSGGDDCGTERCKQGSGGFYDGVWHSPDCVQCLESCSWFFVGASGRHLASVTAKMFSHFIYFIKKFYNFVASVCFQR